MDGPSSLVCGGGASCAEAAGEAGIVTGDPQRRRAEGGQAMKGRLFLTSYFAETAPLFEKVCESMDQRPEGSFYSHGGEYGGIPGIYRGRHAVFPGYGV